MGPTLEQWLWGCVQVDRYLGWTGGRKPPYPSSAGATAPLPYSVLQLVVLLDKGRAGAWVAGVPWWVRGVSRVSGVSP